MTKTIEAPPGAGALVHRTRALLTHTEQTGPGAMDEIARFRAPPSQEMNSMSSDATAQQIDYLLSLYNQVHGGRAATHLSETDLPFMWGNLTQSRPPTHREIHGTMTRADALAHIDRLEAELEDQNEPPTSPDNPRIEARRRLVEIATELATNPSRVAELYIYDDEPYLINEAADQFWHSDRDPRDEDHKHFFEAYIFEYGGPGARQAKLTMRWLTAGSMDDSVYRDDPYYCETSADRDAEFNSWTPGDYGDVDLDHTPIDDAIRMRAQAVIDAYLDEKMNR